MTNSTFFTISAKFCYSHHYKLKRATNFSKTSGGKAIFSRNSNFPPKKLKNPRMTKAKN
jgi:hypothetical protein